MRWHTLHTCAGMCAYQLGGRQLVSSRQHASPYFGGRRSTMPVMCTCTAGAPVHRHVPPWPLQHMHAAHPQVHA